MLSTFAPPEAIPEILCGACRLWASAFHPDRSDQSGRGSTYERSDYADEQDRRSRAENGPGLVKLARGIKDGRLKAPIRADKGLPGVRRIDDGRCSQCAPIELWPGSDRTDAYELGPGAIPDRLPGRWDTERAGQPRYSATRRSDGAFSAALSPFKSGLAADGAIPRGLRGAAADTAATLSVVVVRHITGTERPGFNDRVSRGN